jgi:hypothetical protein
MVYLKFRVPFFENFEKELIYMMVEKLDSKEFDKDQIIMRKGEEGDCMYILF